MTTPDPNSSSTPAPGREALVADIEATRADLGQTVDALSRKLDVKSRARAKATETVAQVRREPAVPAAVLAGAVLLVALVVWRRRS
jgi:hypothetical protein